MTSEPIFSQSHMRRRWVAAVAGGTAAAAAVLAGCDGDATARATSTAHPQSPFLGELVAFDSCAQLLDYYRAKARPLVGAYGLGGYGGREGVMRLEARATADDAASTPAAGTADTAGDYSETNNQESGVDEADQVKTDGRIIVTAQGGGRIHVTDAATATRLATISIPKAADASSELLLSGDTMIVLSTTSGPFFGASDIARDLRAPGFPSERTTVTRVDLSDPRNPKVLGAVRMEGSYRSARMIGDAVRMVMVSQPPGLTFTQPKDNSLTAEDEAKKANQRAIADSTIDDWVPHIQQLNAQGEAQGTEQLTNCAAVARPKEFAGVATLSVVTFDMAANARSVAPKSTVGVVASGETVYASSDRLIVATSPWDLFSAGWIRTPDPAKMTTTLHAFDISNPAATTYTGSGKVAGRLVNQFALDEDHGTIRVATTTAGLEWRRQRSQSSLLVLREQGGKLVTIGRVDGMGLTEQIRSVRYLSPELAAVVTFRQTDPLYLVDTSDPTTPRVAGELKVPGYSAYLHPLGDGRLLGVGQDADIENGQTRGLQASLFDISDPAKPARLAQLTWKDTNSPAEWDHRAFLWWQGKAYLPATSWRESDTKAPGFSGVLSINVGDRTLSEGKRASTDTDQQYGDGPRRVLVIGSDLWTVDFQGLERFDLATLTHEAYVRLSS